MVDLADYFTRIDYTGPVEPSAAALTDKIVHHRRGGYCYEQNGLFGYVLAETHQVLAVRIPGNAERYLVDVGFGGQTLTSPIRLVVDEIQQIRHEPYRLRAYGNGPADGYVLETLLRHRWLSLYTFTDETHPQIDLEVGSWYVSTHPESVFVVGLSAALVTPEARLNLRGRNLAVHHLNGPTEKTRFDNASQVLDVLMNRFGIDVGGLGDVHARITEALDS